MMLRKNILLSLVLCICNMWIASAQTPLADGKSKFLGNIYSSSQLTNYTQYWNQITPENAGKWGSVERTRDIYNWTELDASYQYAKDNNLVFRYHVIVWGNQQPSWIEDLSPEEQLEEITEWMDLIAERYPDIDYLEVANEPLNDPPSGAGNGNYINALGGTGDTGFDWLITAFTMARERFPDVKLMINEYNILNNINRATVYLNAIKQLQDRNLIDVIGVQAHAFTTYQQDVSNMKAVLDLLSETGLSLMVTELDIDGPTDAQQLDEYKRVFPLLWKHPAVVGITLWGWRQGLWRQSEKAYLIDVDGSERPALEWLRTYVASTNVGAQPLQAKTNLTQIYPNPSKDGMVTVISLHPMLKIELIAIDGKMLASWESDLGNSVELNLTDQKHGCYLLRISNRSGVEISKLIIQP